jgi:hypothetical protein
MPVRQLTIALVAILTVWSATARGADEGYPYEAFVCVDQAEVVAGPGHRYYTTERLAWGTKVEIYREELSGWLAIRPPEGSFSWVPSEFVERLEDDGEVGRVKQPTGVWIGTATEHVGEHRQQITLKAGELVQIESEKTITASSGTERKWLKIAPPAGEFRWVHLRDVSRQKPVAPPTMEKTEEPEALVEAEPRRIELPGNAIALRDIQQRDKQERSAPNTPGIELAQYRTTTAAPNSVSENRSLSPDGFVPRKRRDSDQGSTTTGIIAAPAASLPTRTRLDPPPRLATNSLPASQPAARIPSGLSSGEISKQLEQIEVDLSAMVARDRSEWNLAALRSRVDKLVADGADPVARGRARLTLEKINQFEDAFQVSSGSVARGSATPGSGIADKAAVNNSLADPRYDAQGVLKPVVSRKGDKPAAPYAVVDAEGKPIAFVSPSPGLNLNRYLNKQVGLFGRRGYLEELKRPHLMAERVVEIDNHLR